MKVVYHDDFTEVYTHDPAAAHGRMECIVETIRGWVEFIEPSPAPLDSIMLAHNGEHIKHVEGLGLYRIAALAAGGAILAAQIGLSEPSFGLIRPPGHHASRDHSWGFCYFNNMAIALLTLKGEGKIKSALVLDIDLHYGDGTVNILGGEDWIRIHNPSTREREAYLQEVNIALSRGGFDMVGVSAGFDFHELDWGGLLTTDDYRTIGRMVREAALSKGAGFFGVLEGGYNHAVLGENVAAFLEGLSGRDHPEK